MLRTFSRPVLAALVIILVAITMRPQLAAAVLAVEPVITNIAQPVRLVAPDGDPRLFVVRQGGRIEVYDQGGNRLDVFLDISDLVGTGSERGLLGLAFAPDYDISGRFYVDYTDVNGDTQIVRYHVSADPDVADPTSAEHLISVTQPYSNHNGGCLQFGPDGMLYIGLGDGGSAGDPQNRAQNVDLLLGKILRINVAMAPGYTNPPSNPLVGQPGRDEIWAYGLRNPWCFSFDRQTGDLYIADVGQGELEEIDVQPASSSGGENYGWHLMEGTSCYDPPSDCNDGTLVLPVHEYSHGGTPFRCSISGGYVYRGDALPALAGQYFFADYCSGQIWSGAWSAASGFGPVTDWTDQITPPGGFGGLASIGQDGLGELYVVDVGGDTVYRITGTTVNIDSVPNAIALEQNIPNPFNPQTTIGYDVRRGGDHVTLAIFDQRGRRIRTLVDAERDGGHHVTMWAGTDDQGAAMPAGVYVYRLEQAGHVLTRKMVMVR